ncbi:MAG: protein phosphatase 2C domain-containing protein [Sphingobacteriales bacterium]|nr:MAG: protein phosphatase 2C domain-containing protein [Sphingobacteriales bacterium]
MIWKTIGRSVIGSSHIQSGKDCEDAIAYETLTPPGFDGEVLICFASDGAGSAAYAKEAATTSVQLATSLAAALVAEQQHIAEDDMLRIAESVYDRLEALAAEQEVPKNEYSCTLLGCILLPQQSAFIQIGDGAIVRSDDSGYLSPVFWPQNGEYQNATAFLHRIVYMAENGY